MESRTSSKDFRWIILLSLGALVVILSGCAAITPARQEQSPRALASLRLTEQGRMFLENGDLDNAISILERAINLNPSNGQNYYYLSEAWLLKGNASQAKEFNRLAEIHLKEDRRWMRRVSEQRDRIMRSRE
ncbi:MAG: tetratricopeptide repeat protein [Desulfobacteraceae bacterium]|nr:MAG: tetratricopeptide repeat protein [Desulfobacteraceae bacterium]